MTKAILGILLIMIVAIFLLPESDDVMVGAEFNSMPSCLASIQRSSGQKFDKLMKDTPDIVTGYLINGKQFICEKKQTGSKGIYYSGTYWK